MGELTSVQRRRVKAAVEIREEPAREIAYQHTVLCQTSLPYRNPGDGVRKWERHQGAIRLRVDAGAALDLRTGEYVDVGLPYGSRPRLIASYLNAEALRSGSPEIPVEDSMTAFVRRLQGTAPNGQEIARFKDQLTRFAAATTRMAVEVAPKRAIQIDTKIIAAFDLWERDDHQQVLWPSTVRLSLDYFTSLQNHAVPLDVRAMAALANSPLALDVYAWLAQRLHRIDRGKPQRITWKAVYEQFGHGYTRIRAFREAFIETLRLVHVQYQGAKVGADGKGLTLRNSPPPVLCRQSVVRSLDPCE